MRALPTPIVNDRDLLRLVVNNARLNASAAIRPFEAAVAQRYLDYVGGEGNPWIVVTDNRFQPPKDSFHRVYTSPPVALAFIGHLRNAAVGACPMCGSEGNGTLDHFLPKAEYPEFSFFSKNLIPACFQCNTLRQTKFVGDLAGERPIHPYYDAIAGQRLMTVAISLPFDVPAFAAIPWNPPPAIAATVEWHIKNIIEPAGFPRHCQHKWSRLLDKPELYLGTIPSLQAVRERLIARAEESAHFSESRNSWDSSFFHGVSENNDAVNYLTTALDHALEGAAAIRNLNIQGLALQN